MFRAAPTLLGGARDSSRAARSAAKREEIIIMQLHLRLFVAVAIAVGLAGCGQKSSTHLEVGQSQTQLVDGVEVVFNDTG